MTINTYFPGPKSNVPSTLSLFARGTGAGAANLTGVKGVASINWVSTGKYTITLPRKFAGLLGFKASVINSAGTTLSEAFLSADAVAASKTLTMEVFGGLTTVAPTRRDLTAADTIIMEIVLEDSAAKPAGF
jgi:hypothetical protein